MTTSQEESISVKDRAFYLLIAVGVAVSVLTELEKVSPFVKQLCGGDTGGCAKVGASEYSSLLGVPLGYWGVLSYIVLLLLYRYRRNFSVIFVSVMMGAEIYFVYLQYAVIKSFCMLCMANFAVVAILTLLLFVTALTKEKQDSFRVVGAVVLLVTFFAFFIPLELKLQDRQSGETAKRVESITSFGDSSSPYRLEIFTDYMCSHCAHYEETVKRIIEQYPEIYIVFRDVIFDPKSLTPMAVAYTGSVAYYEGQKEYVKRRFETFENQKDIYNYLAPRFKLIPKDDEMRAAIKKKLDEDAEQAEKLGIHATPTTVIISNGKRQDMISGYIDFHKLKPKLEKLLGRQ